MSKIVVFNEAEVADQNDFSNIGAFTRADIQSVVGGAVSYPHHWARFTISQPSAVLLRVNPGALFVDDKLYTSTEQIDVNLQIYLPFVQGDTKWVALLVRGETVTNNENRMFEIDADSGATVMQAAPKTSEMRVTVVVQNGVASPTPIKPEVLANDCCLAYVLLSSTGVVSVEAANGWRVKTLHEVEGRVTILEADFANISQRTRSLETDLANIADRMRTIPRPELMRQIQTDISTLLRVMKLPTTARAYWYNQGLFDTDWDTTHASWLARIRTGIRFAWASIINNQMSLLNPGSPDIKITNNVLLPNWTEAPRITVEGNDGSKDISQQVHTIVTAIEHTVSRTSISYGPSVSVCENQIALAYHNNLEVGGTFTANGQTYQSDGLTTTTEPYTTPEGYTVENPSQWNADPAQADHKIYAVRQMQIDSWTETYWTYVTNTYGVNGSIYGQTFLNSQPMIATSVELYFTRAGSDGEVHLFICETTPTGEPNFVAVLAKSSVPANQLSNGWVKFTIQPTLFEAGKRYAWYTVTNGNHGLATVSENKYAQGSLFWCTDGVWTQGDNLNDFAFRVNAAKFDATRTVVEFQPLTLENGMTEIRLLYAGWAPAGTQLVWQIKPVGASEWSILLPSDNNPLNGLPALTQLRAVFVGTTDLAPCIVMDANARAWASRMRGDMTAPSKVQDFGLSTTAITLVTTVDNFNPSLHTFQNKIMIGSTILTPTATTFADDPGKPGRRTYTSLFSLGAATTSARAMPVMTTSNVVDVPFIQDIMMFAA